MLPSRTRLQVELESGVPAASCFGYRRGAGGRLYEAVRALDDRVDRMPEAREWSGSPTQPLPRCSGERPTGHLHSRTMPAAFADGLRKRQRRHRQGLGGLAFSSSWPRSIDASNVTDQWVVMIDPARMSAEESRCAARHKPTRRRSRSTSCCRPSVKPTIAPRSSCCCREPKAPGSAA